MPTLIWRTRNPDKLVGMVSDAFTGPQCDTMHRVLPFQAAGGHVLVQRCVQIVPMNACDSLTLY